MKLILDIKIVENPPTAAGKTVTIQILRQEVALKITGFEDPLSGRHLFSSELATFGKPDVEEITLGPF